MELIDIDGCRRINRFYGGNAGRKIAVLIDGDPWIVKYPEGTARFGGKHLPSYTTGPLSEYIGSHVYEALGIPVHETTLGVSEGKVVVACRDFAVEDTFADFASIKNSVSEELLDSGSTSSGARGELLDDALTVIQRATAFDGLRDEALERFWDMFVVDAITQNNDRNNGNWGILIKRYGVELAPVFDNGNALFNKRTPSVAGRILAEDRIGNDVRTGVSFFLDGEGRHIHPFDLIAEHRSPDLQSAVDRFAKRWDQDAIRAVVDDIPESWKGISVLDPRIAELYKRIMVEGAERYVLPLAIQDREGEAQARTRLDALEEQCCLEEDPVLGGAAPEGGLDR